MSVVPCSNNEDLQQRIHDFAEALKVEAHKLGTHGLSEKDFYQSGIFRGAIERIRGQFSATMRTKRSFAKLVLDYMQDKGLILDWSSAGAENRHDYTVKMPGDRIAVIELKGCLDGNNTTIFERPAHAEEFILWSVCDNPAADPRHNVWSGIHTRLSAEIIEREKLVDGLIVWDWLCGTLARPCPKLAVRGQRETELGPYRVPPPCIYLFPKTIASVRNNPNPDSHTLEEVHFLNALHKCFGGDDAELNTVRFAVAHAGREIVRTTTVDRAGQITQQSRPTPIRRR